VRATTDEVMDRLRRVVEAAGRPLVPITRDAAGRIVAAAEALLLLHADLSIRQLNERMAATLRAHRAKIEEFLAERERQRQHPAPDGA
jgi:hypothetical protein